MVFRGFYARKNGYEGQIWVGGVRFSGGDVGYGSLRDSTLDARTCEMPKYYTSVGFS